jgi:hypothetical protein
MAALTAALIGCGDNSKKCGPGTTDVDGVCTGGMCTDGTMLDPATNSCVIDPNACQDGTVLVGNECVDPGRTAPDIEEAAEPNALGLGGEDSDDPAGEVELKPVGQHFVIKGKIIPFQDADLDGQLDADFDSYVVVVEQPTMIKVTADGLNGLAAGFVAVAAVEDGDPMLDWTRFGINLTGDMSTRQIYLPEAGVYVVAIADSRTLFLGGGAAGPPTGEGTTPFEYYVTFDAEQAQPTALTLDGTGLANSVGKLNPGETKLFSVPMGAGINTASLNMGIQQAVESVVVTNTRAGTTGTKAVADGIDVDPAEATVVGIKTGDTQIVAADTVYNYAAQPADYSLTIQTRSAGQLSTSGGAVGQPADAVDFSVFFYDVAANGEITGMDLGWDVPVAGVVVDENFFIFAFFTFDPDFGFFFGDTFTSYKGLLRHRTAGRYYFLVFDPAGTATTITATSSYSAVPLVQVAASTPLTGQDVNAFTSNPYSYDAGLSQWEQFRVAAEGASVTGAITGRYMPLDTSFGRLDPLVSTCTVNGTDFCADVFPLFTHSYAEAGTTFGRILIPDTTKKYLITMRPATTTPLPQIQLDLRPRPHFDLGTVAVGTPATRTGDMLSDTVTAQRYLMKATALSGVAVTVTPAATLNTRIQNLNADESANGPLVNNGAAGAPDLLQFFQTAAGFSAFSVTSATTLTGALLYDINAAVTAAVTYAQAAGATAYADACVGGATVAMQDGDEGYSTANINVPAGFDFFGFSTTSFKVNSNGFITFDTASVCSSVGGSCFFGNATIPSTGAPNGLIAPYWDDLITTVCQKTIGTKLVIQWTGTTFATPAQAVAFQAILDGSNDTIEFVYAATPTHVATGTSGTVGLENQVGGAGKLVGFNSATTVTPGAGFLFTPM